MRFVKLNLFVTTIWVWSPSGDIFAQSPNIPYVPTRHDTVQDLLWLAEVHTNDVV